MKTKLILLGVALLITVGLIAFDRSQNPIVPLENARSTPATTTPTIVPVATTITEVTTPAPKPTPAPQPAPTPEPTPVVTGITRSEVALHNSSTSCWTIVSDAVYDLTDWISKHPGGQSSIKSMCGIDSSAMFIAQHGSSGKAKAALSNYFIDLLAQ